MKKAFTLIEILVSVILISIVILGIVKIREQNIKVAKYISQRAQNELSNTLFLDRENIKYSKTKKDAATLLSYMKLNQKTKSLLKKIERKITISPPLPLPETPLPIELRAFMLKSKFSALYYRVF